MHATDQLRDAVFAAASRPEVVQAVARIHESLQRAIDQRRPRCDASGRCCRFEQYGHRLYITTLELAAFIASQPPTKPMSAWNGQGCPFQVDGLCSIHPLRPFGCRIFFCDPTAQDWQQDQYALFHAQLKRLHESLDVPYAYLEWRQALALAGAGHAPPSIRGQEAGGEGEACLAPTGRPTPVAIRLNLLTTRPPG